MGCLGRPQLQAFSYQKPALECETPFIDKEADKKRPLFLLGPMTTCGSLLEFRESTTPDLATGDQILSFFLSLSGEAQIDHFTWKHKQMNTSRFGAAREPVLHFLCFRMFWHPADCVSSGLLSRCHAKTISQGCLCLDH